MAMAQPGTVGDQALVLRGTIESIVPAGGPRRRPRWQVTLRVEAVVAGHFDGETFSFVVHSPVKSGLAAGQHRTVRAEPVPGGYVIDELQWLPGRDD